MGTFDLWVKKHLLVANAGMEGSKPDFGEQILREDLRGEGGASNLAFNEKVKSNFQIFFIPTFPSQR